MKDNTADMRAPRHNFFNRSHFTGVLSNRVFSSFTLFRRLSRSDSHQALGPREHGLFFEEGYLLRHETGSAIGRPDRGEKIEEDVPSPRREVPSLDSIDLSSSGNEENQHLL